MAGRYKPYPEYKPSGVEWLGDIPEGWEAVAVKHIARIENGATPKSGETIFWDGDVPWITPADLGKSESPYIAQGKRNISRKGLASCGATLVPGASVILSSRAPIGTLGISSSFVCTNQGCKSLVPKPVFSEKYLYYFLSISSESLNMLGRGSTFLELSSSDLGEFELGNPPLPEQTKIADFLDHETAKIDALIAKQQRLIALLEEKRQAVISHAVTKGLNPDAPLCPSGIDWLGDVPAHWEVSRLGWISSVVRGGSPRPAGDPALFEGDFSPWVTVAEITKDQDINLWETATFLTKRGSEQCRVFSKGTLLLSNSGGSLGVPKILQIDANANDGVLGFEQLSANISLVYYYLSTLTKFFRDSIKSSGGSTQINLNTDILKQLPIPVPPTNSEQEGIVSFIEERVETFRALTIKSQSAMILLKERRTALISAAVTGKIDVRNWQPPKSVSDQHLYTVEEQVA